MRRRSRLVTVSLLLAAVGLLILAGTRPSSSASKNNFDITSTYIEACSCDMFCPCYFNTHSTTHEHAHFCRANLVFRVDKGYYKAEGLDVTIKPGGPDVVPETVVSGGGAARMMARASALLALSARITSRPLPSPSFRSITAKDGASA